MKGRQSGSQQEVSNVVFSFTSLLPGSSAWSSLGLLGSRPVLLPASFRGEAVGMPGNKKGASMCCHFQAPSSPAACQPPFSPGPPDWASILSKPGHNLMPIGSWALVSFGKAFRSWNKKSLGLLLFVESLFLMLKTLFIFQKDVTPL